ncbi:MAG: hypothetical protein CVV47_13835 [Spirochaetae bacterium HGW-Spirochaetae-3]|nr:MAG: hypothetical protein CVV47_13835 [Spirochaetae bacterium HGW-Spirochaetae-3]
MMAYAESSSALTRDDWAFIDRNVADHGGDAAIAAAAMADEPELILFSLFDYNLERSLWLARRLRAVMPATHFAAFGPEIAQGMPIFKAQTFDALIEGEPETPFLELLSDLSARSLKPRYVASAPVDPAILPDPYLSGALPMIPGKPVLIESARGSPSTPAFSSRYAPGPRYFQRDVAPRVLRLASDRGADEARFVDAALDRRPDFKGFVKSLAAANESGVALVARFDPSVVDDEAVKLLADAAFVAVQADLGSVNAKALEAVGMSLDRDGLERGSRLLWTQGIIVKPDVYLGLPRDGYDSTIDTFDFLGMIGMGQDAELRPMPVSPGSAIRADSAAFGVKEYLERPPYWVVETDWMDEDDLLDAIADFEESFDVAWGAPVAPDFTPSRGGFVSFADLRAAGSLDALLVAPERLSSSVTLLLDADDPERVARVVRAAKDLRKENPYCLWQIALLSDAGIPPAAMVERLSDAFSMPEHYFELSRLYALDPQPDFQVRIFFATASEALALVAMRDRQDLETLFALGDALPGARLLESMPFLAFDREAAPFELLYDVMSAYRDYPDLLVEAPRSLFR